MTEDELLTLARHHANLGMPLGRTRFWIFKRLFTRALWITNSHQVAYNNYVLQVVERLRADAANVRLNVMREIATIRSEVAAFSESDAERAAALGAALARLDILLESIGAVGSETFAAPDAKAEPLLDDPA